jgi:hypothetical protein
MRFTVQLALVGAFVVYLAFFAWPVPGIVKDILRTGVGRFIVLGGISWLAIYHSTALAILGAILYVKSVHSAYHEGLKNPEKKDKKEKKEKKDDDKKDDEPEPHSKK